MTPFEPSSWRTRASARMHRLLEVHREQRASMLNAACGFFFVTTGVMLLRPVRDAMGIAGGLEDIRGLFISTALLTLALNPLFGLLVARTRRAHAIVATFGFFALTLLAFWALMTFGSPAVGRASGQALYVWFSVLNVFGTMVFWALVVDRFRGEQGTRPFAVVAMGGTLGAICGPGLTAWLAQPLGAANLLPLSALFLVVGTLSALRLARGAPVPGRAEGSEEASADDMAPLGGGAWDGARAVRRSPYLAGIAGYVLLTAVMTTLVYLTRLHWVADGPADPEAMAATLANIDMGTQIVFLVLQAAMATRLGRRVGPGAALIALPLATSLGFLALAAHGGIVLLFVLEAATRAVQRGVARPARELLFTLVRREHTYKAKAFIDTFVYRMGDVLGAQLETWARSARGVDGVVATAIPVAAVWLLTALHLGRRYRQQRVRPAARGDARWNAPPAEAE
ncbi:hypothetical protein P6166_02625 [Stenotrophomonas sp. HITSZ_GD]|uniref:NTP/NDP exchange transporter n=1 Tax=Stenotrophomonas sp. HITSZ_GD TaxID=3037248 RepID=UPI00240DDDB8|nr:hypothetical protein [Stenotrophomonas sp. HITSZ_GD]MDG2524253.1 hypothetical protein [Stenotrophomonas sp. HITSZ_GD]